VKTVDDSTFIACPTRCLSVPSQRANRSYIIAITLAASTLITCFLVPMQTIEQIRWLKADKHKANITEELNSHKFRFKKSEDCIGHIHTSLVATLLADATASIILRFSGLSTENGGRRNEWNQGVAGSAADED